MCFSFGEVHSQENISLPDISEYYNPYETTLHPKYTLYHKSNQQSTVFCYFYLPELNFIRTKDNYFEAKIKVKYLFYKSLETKNILDSASKIIEIKKKYINENIITYFDVNVPVPDCKLIIITQDLYNRRKAINIIDVDKSKQSAQNFQLTTPNSANPIFTNYLRQNRDANIHFGDTHDSLLVTLYYPDTATAQSPFVGRTQNMKAKVKSMFYVQNSEVLPMTETGVYTIKESKSEAVFSVTCFRKNYPEIKTPNEMIEPLIYICNTQEYKTLKAQKNKKIAVDNFWLASSPNPQYARTQIKAYYNRVTFSNIMFSTTCEGWKTDRGMIYVIFGPPEVLHKGDNFEEWIYSKNLNQKLVFVFRKQQNIFSNNDYKLERNSEISYAWRNAVNKWRNAGTTRR